MELITSLIKLNRYMPKKRHSTGPVLKEGKAIPSQNAIIKEIVCITFSADLSCLYSGGCGDGLPMNLLMSHGL